MADKIDDSNGAQLEPAKRAVDWAWLALPPAHRELLREVGADQRLVTAEPLGLPIHRLLRSAGHAGLSRAARDEADRAMAVWLQTLRIVVLNAAHPAFGDLTDSAYAQALARTAWHEWGHALSVVRCTPEDIRAGAKLMSIAPTAVSDLIRSAGYRPDEHTHELVANVYAALVERSQHDSWGRPPWLHREIYDIVKRVTGWTE